MTSMIEVPLTNEHEVIIFSVDPTTGKGSGWIVDDTFGLTLAVVQFVEGSTLDIIDVYAGTTNDQMSSFNRDFGLTAPKPPLMQ